MGNQSWSMSCLSNQYHVDWNEAEEKIASDLDAYIYMEKENNNRYEKCFIDKIKKREKMKVNSYEEVGCW